MTVNCGELIQGVRSKKIVKVDFGEVLQHYLSIVTVNCAEFIQGIRSEKIVTVNCGEFLQHTLSYCDGELW